MVTSRTHQSNIIQRQQRKRNVIFFIFAHFEGEQASCLGQHQLSACKYVGTFCKFSDGSLQSLGSLYVDDYLGTLVTNVEVLQKKNKGTTGRLFEYDCECLKGK